MPRFSGMTGAGRQNRRLLRMENESCLNRIIAKSESQNATVTERKIAHYIKENLGKVLHCNLLELAELIGVRDRKSVV